MGSSTGSLLVNDSKFLDELFAAAKELDILIAVHAENESILKQRSRRFEGIKTPHIHSKIRDRSAAITATEQALNLAQKYGNRLGIMHMSTKRRASTRQRDKKRQSPCVCRSSTPPPLSSWKGLPRMGYVCTNESSS